MTGGADEDLPGLGQLVQGRLLAAAAFFLGVVLGTLCCVLPGLVFYVWSVVDAACWRPRAS